jgi:hypothetical protein
MNIITRPTIAFICFAFVVAALLGGGAQYLISGRNLVSGMQLASTCGMFNAIGKINPAAQTRFLELAGTKMGPESLTKDTVKNISARCQ